MKVTQSLIDNIEDLKDNLPELNLESPSFITCSFEYDNMYLSIRFYKVTEDGLSYFWFYNPFKTQFRVVNGSSQFLTLN